MKAHDLIQVTIQALSSGTPGYYLRANDPWRMHGWIWLSDWATVRYLEEVDILI